MEINDQILQALQNHQIKAMVFPAVSLIGGIAGLGIIKAWSNAGHFIGNHSATHQGLSNKHVTLDFFITDVMKADVMFSTLDGWLPLLRFPYLQEGDTPAKRDGMRQWLRTHGYRPAPVSIETSDWHYNLRYLKLLKSNQTLKIIDLERDYLNHLVERADFYDCLAKRVLGRSPSHVMLLHINKINAVLLPKIIDTFKNKGWGFISPKTAFNDPLYSKEPKIIPAGGSIIAALAKPRGEPCH
jgi:peptidoglycan-N-acetylglucosamine deacetylase